MTDEFVDLSEPQLEPGEMFSQELPEEEILESQDPLDEIVFNERHRRDLEGLMYLGDLSKDFEWMGHTFSIRTLTVDELLKIGLITREYEGTLGSDRAYITAMTAASIQSVDGQPLVTPIGPNDDILKAKFKYVKENWYSWTTDAVYHQLQLLELRVQEILDAMGEASS